MQLEYHKVSQLLHFTYLLLVVCSKSFQVLYSSIEKKSWKGPPVFFCVDKNIIKMIRW